MSAQAGGTLPLYDTRIDRSRLVRETDKAMLVHRVQTRSSQPLGADAPTLWLPKRHVRWEQAVGRAIATLHAPMWLCQAEGFSGWPMQFWRPRPHGCWGAAFVVPYWEG